MRDLADGWGRSVAWCAQPREALKRYIADPRRCDVVVTDLSIVELTGVELAGSLREHVPKLPVLLYTGYGDRARPNEIAAAGVRAVLSKSVDPAALHVALRECLSQ
jgi:DNA-binding NarL/FixJ family response regulator